MSDPYKNKAGSVWRRWDLHLHTPGTKLNDAFGGSDDNIWNRYIDVLENSTVQVFGITDYFSCDAYFELTRRYRARKPASTKALFANIELRLSQSISRDGSHPNIHILFDNDPAVCSQEKIDRFLTNLETQATDQANTMTRCSDLTTAADFSSATVSLDSLIRALKDTFGDAKPYLLVFPANNDGLRSTDKDSPRKVLLADRIDKSCDLFFGFEKNTAYFLRDDRYATGESQPKPVVSGSDAHSFDDLERLTGDVAGFSPTWIKADTTFTGLRQICHEPKFRVHIGPTPDVITRQQQDGTKFLKILQINQVADYDGRNGRWFKSVELPFNPELTAIIGNKGGGKSALVDIIGLLGESRQEEHFSFLTDRSRSKKFRQPGFAENFSASLFWLTGKQNQKLLSAPCDIEKPETVRYLPQNYFEQLTNEIEIEQFRNEIEEVVFSHVDETERLGKSSFAELEESKTLQCKHEISSLKQRLRELNFEIVRLEEIRSPIYRRKLVAEIEAKRQELEAIDKAKPKEVAIPGSETTGQTGLAKQVENLTGLLSRLQNLKEEKRAQITALKARVQEAERLRERIVSIGAGLRDDIAELQDKLTTFDLKVEDIIRYSIHLQPLDNKIRQLKASIAALQVDNKLTFADSVDHTVLDTLPDIRAGYDHCNDALEHLKEQLSAPQRRYQAYVEQLSAWKTKRIEIEGDLVEPKPSTLHHLQANLEYVDNTVGGLLEEKYQARREIVRDIFQSKNIVLKFYGELRSSVEERLQSVRTEGFEIQIDASFVIQREFTREFLNHIDQRKRGPFRHDRDALHELGRRIQSTYWNDCDGVIKFCEDLISNMRNHNGEELSIADQAHRVKELYDYLFSLDYLTTRYELQLGGKNLNELSPGEKGLLLLIFYLQLDRKNTPLVIDQPEDNLDNDSIFKVLATCIRDAKKRRQVILVTHNPNLAVGADAEQIVYVKLEKSQDYKFSYESGAIENPRLNRLIIDVLEGSQPAFVKRRLKYGI